MNSCCRSEKIALTTYSVVLFEMLQSKLPAKMSHVESAFEAVDFKLTVEDVAYLEEPYVPHRIVGHS